MNSPCYSKDFQVCRETAFMSLHKLFFLRLGGEEIHLRTMWRTRQWCSSQCNTPWSSPFSPLVIMDLLSPYFIVEVCLVKFLSLSEMVSLLSPYLSNLYKLSLYKLKWIFLSIILHDAFIFNHILFVQKVVHYWFVFFFGYHLRGGGW